MITELVVLSASGGSDAVVGTTRTSYINLDLPDDLGFRNAKALALGLDPDLSDDEVDPFLNAMSDEDEQGAVGMILGHEGVPRTSKKGNEYTQDNWEALNDEQCAAALEAFLDAAPDIVLTSAMKAACALYGVELD